MSREALTLTEVRDRLAWVTLNRPARHNSLVPELLDSLNEALASLARQKPLAIVLAARGESFSTGGDVAAFAALARGGRRAYADRLIGALNEAILRLLDLPCPVIVRLHGPVTGGSAGLVLAADLVAMSPKSYFAPYYVEIGFAPDGGWTALLPERIGAARAAAVQLLNRRIEADEAVRLGLATEVVPHDRLDTVIESWLATLTAKSAGSIEATRQLLLPPERRDAIARNLQRERDRFLELIETDGTEARMARFLGRKK
ncbi:MAG: enoyl-CoA hydratase/isomerase family protein [Hyphomicrobiaceae bacterium]|nr:MAG: enoyl-CoA hydratase/isomerase family protein [Hyphomicrobiaceae bacterium]